MDGQAAKPAHDLASGMRGSAVDRRRFAIYPFLGLLLVLLTLHGCGTSESSSTSDNFQDRPPVWSNSGKPKTPAAKTTPSGVKKIASSPGSSSSSGTPAAPKPGLNEPNANNMGPLLTQVTSEPWIRVRVGQGINRLVLENESPIRVSPSDDMSGARSFGTQVVIAPYQTGFSISSNTGSPMYWDVKSLYFESSKDTNLRGNNVDYPHRLAVHRTGSGFDAVNHLRMEEYLPGVVAKELIPGWLPACYEAQAVAARSYALFILGRSQGATFDLVAGVTNQAYSGEVKTGRAADAVRKTRGSVVAYQDRILPAYYYASSGGIGQDAWEVFTSSPKIPAFTGRNFGSLEAEFSSSRWGPFTRPRRELALRYAAWGSAAKNPIANLRDIRSIRVHEKNAAGRPTDYAITSDDGKTYILHAEQFRSASNQSASGAASLDKTNTLKSGFVDVEVRGDLVYFANGRGYGHGVGMSQHGAQALAQKGYSFSDILQYFYPGTRLLKVY
jgi:stage II sporulation protein D